MHVVNIEYCNTCGYKNKFEELSKHIADKKPDVKINGREGRRGSFEVEVDDTLIHSKLSCLAFPDFDDIVNIIEKTEKGEPVRTKCKEQPITDCVVS